MESFAIDEITNCTNAIITFVINGASTKLPLKEKDITSTINIKGRMFNMALGHAKMALQGTYGIILVDVPESKSGKAYICYNEDTAKSVIVYDMEQQQELTNFLRGLRIHFDMNHDYFGNPKKLITETFVKQLYLKREKVVSELDSETKFYYSWGYRAHVEFDKKLLLEATAKVLKKPSSFFVAKYQEVYDEEDEPMT